MLRCGRSYARNTLLNCTAMSGAFLFVVYGKILSGKSGFGENRGRKGVRNGSAPYLLRIFSMQRYFYTEKLWRRYGADVLLIRFRQTVNSVCKPSFAYT